jgi:transcriptional regulator
MLLQGTLEMLVLQTLRFKPRHGYAISQAIRAGSHELFQVETGSLYPALQRLEKRGLVESEWQVSEYNQRTKVYRLTASGRRHLERERSRWRQVVEAVAALMRPREQR